jgi:hypothetical protein
VVTLLSGRIPIAVGMNSGANTRAVPRRFEVPLLEGAASVAQHSIPRAPPGIHKPQNLLRAD